MISAWLKAHFPGLFGSHPDPQWVTWMHDHPWRVLLALALDALAALYCYVFHEVGDRDIVRRGERWIFAIMCVVTLLIIFF